MLPDRRAQAVTVGDLADAFRRQATRLQKATSAAACGFPTAARPLARVVEWAGGQLEQALTGLADDLELPLCPACHRRCGMYLCRCCGHHTSRDAQCQPCVDAGHRKPCWLPDWAKSGG